MKVFHRTLLACLLLAAPLARADAPPTPVPGCSFDTVVFEGTLVAANDEDGFAVALRTPEEALPQVRLSCEGVSARIELSAPFRVEDENGELSPELAGPFRSFFVYEGERYRNDQRVLTTGSFRDRPISVGVSVGNRGDILPAADNYRYQVLLSVTVTGP